MLGLLVVAVLGASPGPLLDWPLRGAPVVERAFEPPSSAYGPGHRGVDLRASPGDAVLAAAAGRVTYAGLLAGRGVVVVSHGELRTTYEPVDAVVRVGQRVPAGAVLGRLGSGHASCGSCLHWGLLRGSTYLDPLALVRPWRIRLLPVWEDRPGLPGLGRPGAAESTEGRGTPPPAAPDRGAARPSQDEPGRSPLVPGAAVALTAAGALALRRRA